MSYNLEWREYICLVIRIYFHHTFIILSRKEYLVEPTIWNQF